MGHSFAGLLSVLGLWRVTDVPEPFVRRHQAFLAATVGATPRIRGPWSHRPRTRRPRTRRPDIRRTDIRRPSTRRPNIRRTDIRRPSTRRPNIRRTDIRRTDIRRTDIRRPNIRRTGTRHRLTCCPATRRVWVDLPVRQALDDIKQRAGDLDVVLIARMMERDQDLVRKMPPMAGGSRTGLHLRRRAHHRIFAASGAHWHRIVRHSHRVPPARLHRQ
jgi:hypothetical protein